MSVIEPRYGRAVTEQLPAIRHRRVVLAATIGNFVEFYDFTIYAALAPTIATLFFPGDDRMTSLLATFAVFGVAFLLRPVGALVIGSHGDRFGRRGVLALTILLMTGATFAIGLLPGYATIGVLAPIVLVGLRLVQGFSAGGEFGGATSYMIEYAPPRRRGLYGGWQFFSQTLASIVGLALVAALSTLPEPAFLAWGWRIPFLVALPLGLVGLYIRLRLEETPSFRHLERDRHVEATPLRQALRAHGRDVARVMGVVTLLTSMAYLLAFMPTYLAEYLGRSAVEATGVTVLMAAATLVTMPFAAALSDRVGRRPLLLTFCVASLLGIVPVLQLLQGPLPLAVLAVVLLGAILGSAGAAIAAFAELFPTAVRYSGLSIAYALPVSVFGGLAPLAFLGLLRATGDPIAPAYYVLGAAVVATAAALTFPETAPARRPDRALT